MPYTRRKIVGPDGWIIIAMIWLGVFAAIAGFKIVDWVQ